MNSHSNGQFIPVKVCFFIQNSFIMARVDVYQMITDLIIKQLESGVIPWRTPWKGPASVPMNMISKKKYRGFNLWALSAVAQNYDCPFFLSYNQAKMLGGNVIKGERGFPVVFWQIFKATQENENGSTEDKTIPLLKYYTVFNFKQTEGIEESKLPKWEAHVHEFNPIAQADMVVRNWTDRPPIHYKGDRAFYSPSQDSVTIPDPKNFFKDEYFYSTLFHELVHSTGHKSRTDRHSTQKNHSFGSKDYSFEELVAEMGASFFCGMLGIEGETIDQSSAYIQSWIKNLQNDKKILMQASSQAQRAVDYILSHQTRPEELTAFLDYVHVEEPEEETA